MTTVAGSMTPLRRIAPDIVRSHVEQAAFLWAQQDTISIEDPLDEVGIAEIRQRVEVNLDALRIASVAAWPIVDLALEDYQEKGELFVAGWFAIELEDVRRLEPLIAIARSKNERRGLIGALAWHRAERVGRVVRDWIAAADDWRRYIAVGACLEHGVDPKRNLVRLIRDMDPATRALSLRLAGKLKREDLVREIEDALEADDESVRICAGEALDKIGKGHLAVATLRKAAVSEHPDALQALRVATRLGSEADVRSWLGGLMNSVDTAPIAVRGIGMLHDRTVLPWLVERMREPYVAVAARSAFLELFPEAREETKLFTADPTEIGSKFATFFEDDVATVASPDHVLEWAQSHLRM